MYDVHFVPNFDTDSCLIPEEWELSLNLRWFFKYHEAQKYVILIK